MNGLTPAGIGFRLELTQVYLKLRKKEFDRLRAEIETLQRSSQSRSALRARHL